MENTSESIAQIRQVIQYLTAQSLEARVTALDIILAYTATPQHRSLFETTDVCKELLRLLPDQ